MALTRPRITQINTDSSVFTDPILVLHQGASSANTDVGFLFNRANGLVSNVALYWSEETKSFVTAFTDSTGATNANLAVTGYANIRSNVVTANTTISSKLLVDSNELSTSTTTGALVVTGGVGVSGNVYVDAVYANGLFWGGNGNVISTGGAGTLNYTESDTPPAEPLNGDFWYKTTTDTLYQYIDGFWVDVQGATIAAQAASTSSDQQTFNPFLLAGM